MYYWFGSSTPCPDLRRICSGRGYSMSCHLLKRIVTRSFSSTPDLCRTRKLEIPLGRVCCFPGHWTLQRKDSPRLPNAQPEAPFQRLRQVPERLLCCAIRETVVDRYRRMALAALVSLTAGIDPAKPSQELTGKLREADLQVTRLLPSAFPELPKSIRRELERRDARFLRCGQTRSLRT